MYQVQKQKGITLIALVITVIVLIILAGVAISLTVGENGIFNKAKQAKTDYNLAKEKEELELEITNIQIEIASEENREATLNDLYARINKDKYSIELSFDPVATTEDVNTTPTYSVVNKIGSMYYFTVDSKLVITDVETREPKVRYITFSDITWNEGKASITLSTKEEGTIEYKVGETGVYQPGTTIENLSHEDVVYARINNNGEYTEEETKVIYDGIAPEEFTVTISDVTYKSMKISTTGTTDNQTGLASYTYVAETGGNIVQKIENQTVTEYPITGLTDNTEYVVYMLAYDKAGNVRKSNEVTVTTPKYVPPTPSNPQTEWSSTGTPRAGRDLDLGTNYDVDGTSVKYQLTWNDMAEIAKAISNTLTDEDTTNDINNDVYEFNMTYEGVTYLLGVGDRMRVDGKVVRILGFNHDDLVNLDSEGNYKNAYGDGQTNIKAGISFEYATFITSDSKMNSNGYNTNGWGVCDLRTTLNSESNGSILAGVRAKVGADTIKQVKKQYIKTYNSASSANNCYSNDYLWLLSCGEIWSSGYNGGNTRGYAITKEGEQYKYYAMINATYSSSNPYLKKPSTSSSTGWWLRSPYYQMSDCFCRVYSDGSGGASYANNTYGNHNDATPGFAI